METLPPNPERAAESRRELVPKLSRERACRPNGPNLADVIDAASVQSLMEEFFELARIPMAIIDLEGRVLVAVGWQKICVKFHRTHLESCRNCIESDLELTRNVPPGEFRVYKCKNNMWDVATPLMIGDQRVGNVFTGQFFFDDEPFDADLFRAQAQRYGFNQEDYLTALSEAPRLSREFLNRGMAYLVKTAQFLSRLSYSNVELARAVAERDCLTKSLLESADRLSRAQAIAHLGSWELDLVVNRLSWSDEVYRIFGLHPQEFGATYEAFLAAVHPEDRAAVDAAYAGSLREGKASYEITHRVLRSTGEVRWVYEKCDHLRDQSGTVIRSLGMVQDITDRHLAEERLRHKQKLESIGLLAAGIAHDFNNLLVGVVGNAGLAQTMLDTGHPVNELLDSIVESGQRAADLTRQMLAYAGKGQFHIERLDLSELAEELSSLMRPSISNRISLSLKLERGSPPIQGDRGQIQQVFMNLVLNAAEAIGDATGVISVKTSVVDADERFIRRLHGGDLPVGRYVCLEVIDSGCGMDAVTQTKIFDPFFSTKFTGRGLGLAAVGGIMRRHGGVIQVASAPAQGSHFTVLLPALPHAEARAPGVREPGSSRGTETILVVDDENSVREVVRKTLEFYGYSVLTAAGGCDAIELCKRHSGAIAAVILDSSMPGLSGEATLPELLKVRPALKVIVSSGYGEGETLQHFEGQRVGAFVQKPYAPRLLAEKLRAVLDTAN